MSTTAYSDSPRPIGLSRRSFREKPIRDLHKRSPSVNMLEKTNSVMRNSPTRNERTNDVKLAPPTSRPPSVRPRSSLKNNQSDHLTKRTYTFSNPPRATDTNVTSNYRTSSAPTQVSPPPMKSQQKSASANQTSKNRSVEPVPRPPPLKAEPNSIDSSSKAPKSVQKVRILLFGPSSTDPNIGKSSPRKGKTQIEEKKDDSQDRKQNNASLELEADVADSMQLAAILAKIQSFKDPSPVATTSTNDGKRSDLRVYEYDASNLLETATFRLSPRTLKPAEELEIKSRSDCFYRNEMRSSSNAQMPALLTSIVAETNNFSNQNHSHDRTFTFRLNPNGTIQTETNSEIRQKTGLDHNGEQIQLFYDATLEGFFDPNTGLYYELTST